MSENKVLAGIDCGSHSTRLIIAEISPEQPQPKTLHKDMHVTRLSTGVKKNKQLSEEAIADTLNCINEYLSVLKDYPHAEIRIVATAAARMAENSDDFFAQIQKLTGVVPELLSGEKEAELSFRGATSVAQDFPSPYLCLDIGGGSSEFSFGEKSCDFHESLDIGSVNLTENYIAHDPPQPDELYACLSLVEAHLSDLIQQAPQIKQAGTFIGMAGTVTTAAAVELGYYDPDKVHHFRLSIEALEDVFRTLSTEDREQRKSNPGLHPDRVDVIVAGLTILVKTMRFFGFQECLVSEADLLDGIILDMAKD